MCVGRGAWGVSRRTLLRSVAYFALVAACGLAARLPADDDKGSGSAPSFTKDDVATVIYFGKDRPILFRFYFQIDGQPVQAGWEKCLTNLFNFLDRNGDGVLSKDEAARAPSRQQLLSIVRVAPTGSDPKINFTDLDEDSDGKVSLEEFLSYYRRVGLTSVAISGIKTEKDMSDAASEALFKILDQSGDGVLTKEKADKAWTLLAKYDSNDDELITPAEIMGIDTAIPGNPGLVRPPPPQPDTTPDSERRFFVFGRDDSPRGANQKLQLAHELVRRYDKNSDEKLSREELSMPADVFKALDRNKDGVLDEKELVKFALIPADLEMVVRLGKKEDKERTLDFYPTLKEAGSLAPFTRTPSSRVMHAISGVDHFDLVIQDVAEAGGFNAVKLRYLTAMRAADPKENGYVTRADIRKNTQALFLEGIFDTADRDGDGKLTEKELLAFLDIVSDIDAAATSVKVGEFGRGLFNLLDVNRDGALSQYELKHAWESLMPEDPKGRQSFSLSDISQQMQIQVNTGLGSEQVNRFISIRGGPVRNRRTDDVKAPGWFHKMDQNGDGYVSRREFLGSKADFDRIDLDHDGLIDPDEAEKATPRSDK